jgi:hypothetical protein
MTLNVTQFKETKFIHIHDYISVTEWDAVRCLLDHTATFYVIRLNEYFLIICICLIYTNSWLKYVFVIFSFYFFSLDKYYLSRFTCGQKLNQEHIWYREEGTKLMILTSNVMTNYYYVETHSLSSPLSHVSSFHNFIFYRRLYHAMIPTYLYKQYWFLRKKRYWY